MDNRIFDINGEGDETLTKVLELAFDQGAAGGKCESWEFNKEKGLILSWSHDKNRTGSQRLPSRMNAKQIMPLVSSWLASEESKAVELGEWEKNADIDGNVYSGWRVYCEDWGHVGGNHYAICAIKRVFLWSGK